MIALVDFENTSDAGFSGIETLTEKDGLVIFFSEKTSRMSVMTHHKIESAQVAKEYIPVKTGGKNALDFQLSTYLGFLIASDGSEDNDYCIISNDTGYDFIVNFWKSRGKEVLRFSDLSFTPKSKIQNDVKAALPEYSDDVAQIIEIIEKYKTKSGVNNALVKLFGSDKAGKIYKAIKPMIKSKKG